MKWLITFLAILQFGFMAFDGTRALTIGDYIRPKTGAHAGQLGPWSGLASAVGVNPEGRLMKWTFLLLGTCGLVAALAFASGRPGARNLLIVLNVLSAWYLVIGTITSIAQILLLTGYKIKKRP